MATAVLVPAAAMAGKKVVSGQQSLQLKVSLTPSRAGASGVTLRLHEDNLSTKPTGQQLPYNAKSIIFRMAKGLIFHPAAAGTCLESTALHSAAGAAACPTGSKVGKGSVTVNARPTIPKLITGTVAVYNGVDDGGYGGYPKGSRIMLLYLKTSIGLSTTNYFHIVKTGNGSEMLVTNAPKPSKPGIAPGDFTLQTLDLSVSGSGRAPYLTNPRTCTGSWPFSLTITDYFGQPSVTAGDRVQCHK